MTNKKIQIWLPLLFSLTMVVGMWLGYKMRDAMPGRSFFYMQRNRPVQEILDLLNSKYVDDVRLDSLADTAIQAILARLDPHSVYIPADDLNMVNEDMDGYFYGVGIEYEIFDDTVHILNMVKDGPAEKAGLQVGDRLIKVGDSLIAGTRINGRSMKKLLHGKKGSKIAVSLLRNGKLQQAVITRNTIAVSSVDASYMIDSNIGYIRLNRFSQVTYREFMQALDELHKNGLKKLILDLRGNGGGVLDQATAIADEFLEGAKLITYTEGKHSAKKEYRCQKVGFFEKEPLVVLADEGSASASEVLLGALQDWDRATIIGRRSFGKGLVQEQYNLSDGSALRLTIARYYTPLQRSIQRSYSNGQKAYYKEMQDRFNNLAKEDTLAADTKNVYTSSKGKKLYGGGGIWPDINIAPDTTCYDAMGKLNKRGSISNFTYSYYLTHKDALKVYTTPAAFQTFVFTDAEMTAFSQQASRDSVFLPMAAPVQKEFWLRQLRSALAHQLWHKQGYWQVINAGDAVVGKAVSLLKQP